MEVESDETMAAKDGRLKLSLKASAKKFLEKRKEVERMEGRELSVDEAMLIILGFCEVTNPDKITQESHKVLRDLERFLEEHKEDLAAGCVSLFREALLDVLRGRIQSRHLSEALLNVQ